MTYDPENWLESLTRTLKAYVADAASDVYDVVMEFPGTQLDRSKVPLEKTLIHFEIDDETTSMLGIGDNVFANNYNVVDGTVTPQEARRHVVNFDVGIWSFARTGGTTARLRAYQLLTTLFSGAQAIQSLREYSDGGDGSIEIISFSGGRYVNDTIGDVPVYRVAGASLEVRVFSRTKLADVVPVQTIEAVDQNSGLTIIG